MFKEIKDEKAFDGILNQIIDNIQNGHLKAGDALPAERTMAETMGQSARNPGHLLYSFHLFEL